MALLNVVTWLWGSQYNTHYVDRLAGALRRHLKQPYLFSVVSDQEKIGDHRVIRIQPEDAHLLKIKGCFVRLRMFDPEWQDRNGITDRLVCFDLDTVLTGAIDQLFDRPEPFCILQGGNYNPCAFNGSLQMIRAGAHPEVWSDFTLEKASKVPFYQFPDDQGWLWHKVPNAAGWKVGTEHGCYVFQKPGWPKGSIKLPIGARYVTFAGWRDPSKFMHLGWVKRHWQVL